MLFDPIVHWLEKVAAEAQQKPGQLLAAAAIVMVPWIVGAFWLAKSLLGFVLGPILH